MDFDKKIQKENKQIQSEHEDKNNLAVFEDFPGWFDDVVRLINPDLIVAIARGAIRLLEIHQIDENSLCKKIICDTALPFFSNSSLKNKRILIFDDSLIFGSTMANIRDYIYAREGIPFCSAFVVDRRNFFGETKSPNEKGLKSDYSDIPLEYGHKLWPAGIRSHHDQLVRKILDSNKHYNLDYPTIELKSEALNNQYIDYFITKFCSLFTGSRSFEVSSAESASNNVYRFSVLMPCPSESLFIKEFCTFRNYTKVRLTFDLKLKVIHLTPIVQLAMVDDISKLKKPFMKDNLNCFWQELNKAHVSDCFIGSSSFRLLTSFVSIIFLKNIVTEMVKSEDDFAGFLNKNDYHFVEKDLQYGLGWENTEILLSVFKKIRTEDLLIIDEKKEVLDSVDVTDFEQNRLISLIESCWEKRSHLKPNNNELVYETLGKLFFTLRQITDSKEIRKVMSGTERINTGLSYDSLEFLLINRCGCSFTSDEISIGIDICVDNGQAVPKIVASTNGWVRNFYSGEHSDAIEPLQLKNYIRKAYSNYVNSKKSKLLTPFEFHKICVTLKDMFPWLPISTKFAQYGRIAMPKMYGQDLISWLTNSQYSPFYQDRNSFGKKVIKLSSSYKESMQSSWPKDKARSFLDGFYCLSVAFSKLNSDHQLLLSTCRTQRHTYNAIAYEVHAWSHKNNFCFEKIASLDSLNVAELREGFNEIVDNMYWCCQYVIEVYKKWHVFNDSFDKLKNKVENIFSGLGVNFMNLWNYELSPQITKEKDKEIDIKFRYLMPIVNLIEQLTRYCMRLLLSHNVINLKDVEVKFQNEGISSYNIYNKWLFSGTAEDAAFRYNYHIDNNKIFDSSNLKTKLAISNNIVVQDSTILLEDISKCYYEIRKLITTYCPEYRIVEGDFPFSPRERLSIRQDGSKEIYMKNAYILAIDIVGSTNNSCTNMMKLKILEILSRFKHKNLYFETTGNDAYIVCSDEPFVLIDICQLVCADGECCIRNGENLLGTRKGLAFGTLIVHIDNEGRIAIFDAMIPNIIPGLFSVLSGLDNCDIEDMKNSLIIVEKHSESKFIKAIEGFKRQANVNVKAKHYIGNCPVYNLCDKD